jgi:hypothetical protein
MAPSTQASRNPAEQSEVGHTSAGLMQTHEDNGYSRKYWKQSSIFLEPEQT